jgi:hypothetical protein
LFSRLFCAVIFSHRFWWSYNPWKSKFGSTLRWWKNEVFLTRNRFCGSHQGCQIFLGTTYQNENKYTKTRTNIPNRNKIYQMATKYAKRQQNIPNKIYHMATKYTK